MGRWCQKSGLVRQKGFAEESWDSYDKPQLMCGGYALDSGGLKLLQSIAGMQPRDFVLMDLKGNLNTEGREQTLLSFPSYLYKRIAYVAVGDPTPDFKKFSQGLWLAQKQAVSDKAFKIKQAEEKQKRLLLKRQKMFEKEKKKQ